MLLTIESWKTGNNRDGNGAMGVSLLEHRRNKIFKEARVELIAMVTRGLEWFGHVQRRHETENIRAVAELKMEEDLKINIYLFVKDLHTSVYLNSHTLLIQFLNKPTKYLEICKSLLYKICKRLLYKIYVNVYFTGYVNVYFTGYVTVYFTRYVKVYFTEYVKVYFTEYVKCKS